jgi:DNA primase
MKPSIISIPEVQIGLAPKASGFFRKAMYGKSYSNELLVDAGLLVAREGSFRDFFYDRITFPIHSPSGDVIGFSARKYKDETFGGKYVNTPETALFKKSRVLFGLNYSRKRIAKERRAIIVEGQIDALRLIQSGFNMTVAGQGTAFGEDHARELINLGVNQVYLSLDGDDAGREATRKIGNIFQREGVEARVLAMPRGKDPDAFLREFGPESFLKLIEQSSDYLTFLVDHLSHTINMDSPAGKNELIQTVTKQVRDWKHPVMIHDSLKKLAQITHIPEEMIGVGQEYIPNVLLKKSASIGGIETIDPHRILEGDLIRWLLLMGEANPHYVSIAKNNIRTDDLHSSICRELFTLLMTSLIEKKPLDLLTLATQVEDPDGQRLLSEIMHKKINRDRSEQQFVETIQRILDRNWMEKREAIRMQIHQGQSSDDELLELAKEFDALKRSPPKVKIEDVKNKQ